MASEPPASRQPPPEIDITVPHSARIWNYWLGGKDNYAVDRAAGDAYLELFPQIADVARASRYFLARAVRFLVSRGIRQFLDVGTGLPTVDNTHEIAQRVAPDCRVVYVDNDPLVLAHARALLSSAPEGATDYIDADMRHPAAILAAARATLDFTKPAGLILLGVLGHITSDSEAYSVVSSLLAGLPSGSYLALADSIDAGEGHQQAARRYRESGAVPYHLRSRDQIAEFFCGLEWVEPGLVPVSQWRPEPSPFDPAEATTTLAGVGYKP